MKKLLSLLTVLTISGTAVPTTIAASPYQKEEQEIKLENNENKQTDNKLSLALENNNNFSWWDTISAFWGIGIKKAEKTKNYLVKNIKNVLENLKDLIIKKQLFNLNNYEEKEETISIKVENKEINVFDLLPHSVWKNWNSRSPRIDIKRKIVFNSNLPSGINPDVLKLSDLTSRGTTVKINTTFNGLSFSGSKYVNFD